MTPDKSNYYTHFLVTGAKCRFFNREKFTFTNLGLISSMSTENGLLMDSEAFEKLKIVVFCKGKN